MNKLHFRTKPEFLKLSRFRLVAGILLWLLYSGVIYSFLYAMREVIRVNSLMGGGDLWVLSDEQVSFYNLFFAFLSVILSQSVCINYWFNKPNRVFEKRDYRKNAIVIDQLNLNWYFISWFSKVAVVFGLYFGMHGSFYVFGFYPEFKYLFLLIIVVLFLQTWKTLRVVLRPKSFRWMMLIMVLFSIVSYGLSKINLIDYKELNHNILKNKVEYNYNFSLPESSSYELIYSSYYVKDIYLVYKNNEPKIVIDNKEVERNELVGIVSNWQSEYREFEIPKLRYKLHIDRSMQMKFVNHVKAELSKSGIYKIAYTVIPENRKYDKRYYKDYAFTSRIPATRSNMIPPPPQAIKIPKNVIEVSYKAVGEFYINSKPIKQGDVTSALKSLMSKEPDYIIEYTVDDNMVFSEYLNILIYSKNAIDQLRDEYSKQKYLQDYDSLDYDVQFEARRNFPLRVWENTIYENVY